MADFTLGDAPQRWRQERRALDSDPQVATVEHVLPEERHAHAPRTAVGASSAAESSVEPYLVSCIMPAYNEREAISSSVSHLLRAAERLTREFEIIVVDDGSTDGTRQILEQMSVHGLRVVGLPHNRGYGHALRAGFAAAIHPLVFFTDSDNQFDATDLGRLLPLVADADIVVGYRVGRRVGYRVGRRDGTLRSMLSGGYNMLVRGLLGLSVRDVNCAFKLVRRDALAGLCLTSDGYAINAEMLARAQRHGLRVREVAVSHRPRTTGRSKVGLKQIPRALLHVIELSYAIRSTNGRRHGDSDRE